jgi:hypothetical protein
MLAGRQRVGFFNMEPHQLCDQPITHVNDDRPSLVG